MQINEQQPEMVSSIIQIGEDERCALGAAYECHADLVRVPDAFSKPFSLAEALGAIYGTRLESVDLTPEQRMALSYLIGVELDRIKNLPSTEGEEGCGHSIGQHTEFLTTPNNKISPTIN